MQTKLSFFINFLPEQLNLEGHWVLAILEMSYLSMYQDIIEGNIEFSGTKLAKSSEFYYLEHGLYPSITDTVETINSLSRKTRSQWELYHSLSVSKNAKNWELPCKWRIWSCIFRFFGTDLGHIFGSNNRNEFGVMLRRKGPHKPEVAYDIVHIHSLKIYKDLIEYNIVGDKKDLLMRCFLSISRLKAGDNIITG